MSKVTALQVSRAASLFSLGGGILVLIGWATDTEILFRPTSGCVVIVPWTALCFVALGLALLGRTLRDSAWSKALVLTGSLLVLAVMGFVLLEWIVGSLAGFDAMLFGRRAALLAMGRPGRPSLQAVFSFLTLAGATLAGLRVNKTSRQARWVEALIFFGSSIGLLTLFGYACSASMIFGAPTIKGVQLSPYSAVLILSCALALIAIEPDSCLGRIYGAAGPSGYMIRRLFPVFVIVPLLLGLLRTESERRGWISRETGVAFMAFAQFLIGMGMLFWVARSLSRVEELKKIVKMSCVSKLILDEGKWVTVEKYLSEHYNVEISHGMTREEADIWLHEGMEEIETIENDRVG